MDHPRRRHPPIDPPPGSARPVPTHQRLSAHGYWTYDFALPGLVLDAFYTGQADRLASHLAESPDKQFTTLDSHDGIPVDPDLEGLLEPRALRDLAERTIARGGNVNHVVSADPAEPGVHQLNCSYFSALDSDDDLYVAARAIQLFARGVPQIYYVGLLAGENDLAAFERTGEGRAVNRHDYTTDELRHAFDRPVVKRLTELIQLRNTHPAFDGNLHVEHTNAHAIQLHWSHREFACSLRVDLATGVLNIYYD